MQSQNSFSTGPPKTSRVVWIGIGYNEIPKRKEKSRVIRNDVSTAHSTQQEKLQGNPVMENSRCAPDIFDQKMSNENANSEGCVHELTYSMVVLLFVYFYTIICLFLNQFGVLDIFFYHKGKSSTAHSRKREREPSA
jgi:hypothetical protein